MGQHRLGMLNVGAERWRVPGALSARSPCYAATSSNALGFLSATSSNVLAGPDGARLPCSHSCSVRTDTPINLANSDCDRPVLPRIFATEGTVVTRPTSPRLICRIPSRISTPMFRSFFVIAELLPDLAQDMRRDVLGLVLRIDRQHPDNALGDPDEVDHPHATSLAPSGCGPSQLPDASRPRNDVS